MSNVVLFPAGTRNPIDADPHGYIEWVRHGIDQGYCSEQVCAVHDPMAAFTDEENEAMWETGEPDHCVFILRLHET